MTILVCRVAWMPFYRSDDEPAIGGGQYVEEGNVPHESRNFLPIGETYYGFVENGGNQITIENLGAQWNMDTIDGVSVVFCARDPETHEYLVTGWYSDTEVHRQPFPRPDDPNRTAYFMATDATLISPDERCFRIPTARDNPPNPFSGIGQHHIWYGLNPHHHEAPEVQEACTNFRDSLIEYMEGAALNNHIPQQIAAESRRRRISERLERKGRYRGFIDQKGYRCEACGWSIEDEDVDVWGSSFELHHLVPVAELGEGNRVVTPEDFAVLCASCHRAIHRTDHVNDVEGFILEHPRP